jgi:hypothetical protein
MFVTGQRDGGNTTALFGLEPQLPDELTSLVLCHREIRHDHVRSILVPGARDEVQRLGIRRSGRDFRPAGGQRLDQ